MSPQQKKCFNPGCHVEYTIDSHDVDDGFCSYTCWEHVNCGVPKRSTDILDTNVEEILHVSN
jgi:hypothetical protein